MLALHEIAAKLRAKRFGSGALRLDNTKLNFSLDADGNPEDAHPHGKPCTTRRSRLCCNLQSSRGVFGLASPMHVTFSPEKV